MMLIVKKKDSSLFSASFVLNNNPEHDHLQVVPKSLNLPTRYASYKLEHQVLGSCNGVLCLAFPTCCILWNPSTRTHHVMQPQPTSDSLTIKIDGLGYDEVNDGYKLVRFVQIVGMRDDDQSDTQIWVHRFNSGSWNMVSRADWSIPSAGFTDVFVDGCLHFKMRAKSGMYEIVSFDVSNESYKLITRPYCVDMSSTFDLGVLDGNLCMAVKINREVETFQVLKVVKFPHWDSWVVLFRFEMKDGPKWMRPITYVGGNQSKKKLVMEGGGALFCFDMESRQKVPITGQDCKGFTEVWICTESQRILDTADDDSKQLIMKICIQSDQKDVIGMDESK